MSTLGQASGAGPARAGERHARVDGPSNYILIYDVGPDRIRILRVLHARRQWPSRN
ncbi:type II toxin-antitoxin system RelE/ParE family toxin [Rhizorhabdus histidinilytica]|uniref:type II toxin-antitoxin system RelE/ParE family toxin n=1 Tax=Rhizorhabdus histidinilytica TaxID=439228 RepID=UPI003D30117B